MEYEAPAKRARKQSEKAEQSVHTSKIRLPYTKTKPSSSAANTHSTIAWPANETTKIQPSVVLSLYDKAPQLRLSDDQLICYGCEGGYRMVRATHGVHEGSYYWETEVLVPAGEDSHVRIGWSTREGELQAPVGYDKHSYAYRDTAGAMIHKSMRIDDYGEPYGVGDIIGCFISLQPYSNQNKISFFKNGKDQGIAYSGEDIPFGVYFPAISLYRQAAVRVNFGPTFIIKPEINGYYLPISELQPLNPADRKIHELNIALIRKSREEQKDQQEGGGVAMEPES